MKSESSGNTEEVTYDGYVADDLFAKIVGDKPALRTRVWLFDIRND